MVLKLYSMAFDLTTLFVWALRILLPLLFFGVYFRLQAEGKPDKGSTANAYSRGKLLSVQRVMKDCPVPEALQSIALKDQNQAPHLFGGGRQQRGPRADKSGQRGAADDSRAPRGDKPRVEKREKKDPEPPTGAATVLADEKMDMESLLNYVAFNRNEGQKGFLASDSSEPPRPARKKLVGESVGENKLSSRSGAAAQKANNEAQMVLRGAIGIKRPEVATHLYDQLIEANVEIAESTFICLIDVCIGARDLKGAGDFLMKLEDAGFKPDSVVLDKVLDLYSEQQTEREQPTKDALASLAGVSGQTTDNAVAAQDPAAFNYSHLESLLQPNAAQPWQPRPAPTPAQLFNFDAFEDSDDDDDEPEVQPTKLSSDAPVFVPSFIPGPPEPSLETAEAQD